MTEAAADEPLGAWRRAVRQATLTDEGAAVTALLAVWPPDAEGAQAVTAEARRLVEGVRAARSALGSADDFLSDFGLNDRAGLALMAVAEALLRIPDQATADRLVRDKIPGADWARYRGRSHSLLINLTSSGLLLAGWLAQAIPSQSAIVLAIGFASAVVDNIPLVAAAQGMYGLDLHPTDSALWPFLAYCAGTGGSLLVIGSAAGVAAMGLERIPFFWYARRIGPAALAGYLAGAAVFLLQRALWAG